MLLLWACPIFDMRHGVSAALRKQFQWARSFYIFFFLFSVFGKLIFKVVFVCSEDTLFPFGIQFWENAACIQYLNNSLN